MMDYIVTVLASYGAFEIFIMASKANKERRPLVITQVGCGFAFCVWAILYGELVSWGGLLGLIFIATDRLQTRISHGWHIS